MYCPITGRPLTRNHLRFRRELPEKDTVVFFPEPQDVGKEISFRDGSRFKVTQADQSRMPMIKYPFVYESYYEPKLGVLRHKLGIKAKTGSDLGGYEAIAALYRISRYEILDEMSAWGLPEFWDFVGYGAPGHNTHGACGETSHRFTCIASACGLIARKVNIGRNDEQKSLPHMVTEVWSDEHQKWVYWDAMIPYYFEDTDTGIPLSMAEVQERHFQGRPDSMRIRSWRKRNEGGMSDELITVEYADRAGTTVENRWADRFFWCAAHMGNNYLAMPANRIAYTIALLMRPELDEDHWKEAGRFVGYYEQKSVIEAWDIHNLYTPQNQVEVHIADSPSGALVGLAHYTPNFDHLEVRINGGDWDATEAITSLTLANTTTIEARTVNAGGICGKAVEVALSRVE